MVFLQDNSSTVAYLQNQRTCSRCPCSAYYGTSPPVPEARDLLVSETHPHSSGCSSRQAVEKASVRMVPTPWHSVPDVLHLVHSRTGSVLQLATIASRPYLCLQFPDPRAVAVDALSIPRDRQ